MTYRRKTLSSPGKVSSQNSKQVNKKQKKLAPYSPNTRYQNVKKLSMNKKTSSSGKKYKPSNKKFNPGKKKKYKGYLTVEAFGSFVRVSFDGRLVGRLAFGVHVAAAPQSTPAQAARTPARADATDLPDPGALSLSIPTPADRLRPSRGETLPLVFSRTATGPVYEDWSGDGTKGGLDDGSCQCRLRDA